MQQAITRVVAGVDGQEVGTVALDDPADLDAIHTNGDPAACRISIQMTSPSAVNWGFVSCPSRCHPG
jgi:hypothetical protein